ncbi:tripartite tricarboxylate transporter substrate binding protein [Cupriavidus sp. L7L]|uniref:Bug family tripartite tricarboxylate transporter substrate binding protein n=1 Tax=Cupriavidus sp. L7L TaxID=2546443 RepID=UPI001056CC5F|nr:tripartite tricarboxylate transporter substrate binding protein [Cupriavidus sp. L7L]TDF64977.1 tripartite tricarboxylate transporter substrate binding protein [Cupriavidus sp. L7L]
MKVAFKSIATAVAISSLPGWAMAQTYPDKPITLIAPFAPGASADGVARVLGRRLSTSLGKPVVVENRPGGGGTTGLITLSKSAPDGYTLAIGATGALAVNKLLPDAAPLDTSKLLPIAKVVNIPLVMVASQASGFHTLDDATMASKKEAGGISYGTSGQYTMHHLAGQMLVTAAKAKLIAVPYRGSTPALTDVIAGQIPLAIVDLTSAAPQIKAGKVAPLAIMSAARAKAAPNIPTVAEKGYQGFDANAWLGLFAPAGTPEAIVTKVSDAIQTALRDPAVEAELTTLATEPAYLPPAEFKRYIDAESRKWARVVSSMKQPPN